MPTPIKNHLCAIITSYNPDSNFIERLSIISKQADQIVIIDNNSDATTIVLLKNISFDSKIYIIYNANNLGVATALNQGIHWAKNKNYTWVLLLDQDTSVSINLVEVLLCGYQKVNNKEQVGIIGPSYLDTKSEEDIVNPKLEDTNIYNEVRSVITSGSLIKIDVFEKIGFFREDLFIDFVDIEYCLRARASGYKVYQVNTLLMQHSIGSVTTHKLPWKNTGTSNHSPLRRYYMMRNNIIVAKEYLFIDPKWAINSIFRRIKSTLLMCFFEKQRILKLRFSIIGIIDGLLGKMDRVIK